MSLFISFEGPDGSGKSTQARLLAEVLRSRRYRVVETREPGGTALGERIRSILLDPDAPAATPLAMTLMISAARAELVSEIIQPALKSGKVVISDRFADSTLAYQAFGSGVDVTTVREVTHVATAGVYPDVVMYVDVSTAVGLDRASARGSLNRFDAQDPAFHQRVRDGYLQLVTEEPDRWFLIDGAASVQSVHLAVLRAIEPVLERTRRSI